MIPLILKIWLISDREKCLPKYILLVAQALPFFGEIVGEIFSLDAEQRVTVITLTRGDVSKQIIRALYIHENKWARVPGDTYAPRKSLLTFIDRTIFGAAASSACSAICRSKM